MASATGGRLFNKIDADKSGGLSRDEWNFAFDSIANKANGTISRKEWTLMGGENSVFESIARKGRGPVAVIEKKDWRSAFDRIDKDGDGEITSEEWSIISQAYKTVVQKGGLHASAAWEDSLRGTSGSHSPRPSHQHDNSRQARGEVKEKLRIAAETIHRNERSLADRNQKSQRAEWFYQSRLKETEQRLKQSQEMEKMVEARLNEKRDLLQKEEKEFAELKAKVEMLEVHLAAASQQRQNENQLQEKLDKAQVKATRLEARLSDAMGQLRQRKEDDPSTKIARSPGGGKGTICGSSAVVKQACQQALLARHEQVQGVQALGSHLLAQAQGKPIGLYFAAASMGCQDTTRQLAANYRGGLNKVMEVFFVALDASQADFDSHIQDMPWPTIPFASQKEIRDLSKICRLQADRPQLAVANRDGTLLTTQGLSKMLRDPKGASFPEKWAPKDFTDIDEDASEMRAGRAVIGLAESRNQKLALAVRSVAKDFLQEANGDVGAMAMWFFTGSLGNGAQQVRNFTQAEGDKLVFLDLPNKSFCMQDASQQTTADEVRQFIIGVVEGTVRQSKVHC